MSVWVVLFCFVSFRLCLHFYCAVGIEASVRVRLPASVLWHLAFRLYIFFSVDMFLRLIMFSFFLQRLYQIAKHYTRDLNRNCVNCIAELSRNTDTYEHTHTNTEINWIWWTSYQLRIWHGPWFSNPKKLQIVFTRRCCYCNNKGLCQAETQRLVCKVLWRSLILEFQMQRYMDGDREAKKFLILSLACV